MRVQRRDVVMWAAAVREECLEEAELWLGCLDSAR